MTMDMALDVITLYCDSDNNVDRMMVELESPMKLQKNRNQITAEDLQIFCNVHP